MKDKITLRCPTCMTIRFLDLSSDYPEGTVEIRSDCGKCDMGLLADPYVQKFYDKNGTLIHTEVN